MLKRYSESDIIFLKQNHKKMNALEISNILGRSVYAVRVKMSKLGLLKTQKIITGKIFGRLKVIEKDNSSIPSNPYYFCQCSCDNKIVSIRGSSLSENSTLSCGCLQKQSRFKNAGESSFKTLYNSCKSSAEQRDYIFDLSLNDFKILISKLCHYCGSAPKPYNKYANKNGFKYDRIKSKETFDRSWILANGIDRKDNSIGYTMENSVPCCSICNHAKHTLNYEEFIKYLENLVNFRNQKSLIKEI